MPATLWALLPSWRGPARGTAPPPPPGRPFHPPETREPRRPPYRVPFFTVARGPVIFSGSPRVGDDRGAARSTINCS